MQCQWYVPIIGKYWVREIFLRNTLGCNFTQNEKCSLKKGPCKVDLIFEPNSCEESFSEGISCLLGVVALWDDCMFIPADLGS